MDHRNGLFSHFMPGMNLNRLRVCCYDMQRIVHIMSALQNLTDVTLHALTPLNIKFDILSNMKTNVMNDIKKQFQNWQIFKIIRYSCWNGLFLEKVNN